jgi:hypothetical protein
MQRMMLPYSFNKELAPIGSVPVREFLKHVPTEEQLKMDAYKPIAEAIKNGEYKVAMQVGNTWRYPIISMNHVRLHSAIDQMNLSEEVKNMDMLKFAKSMRV